MDLPTPLFQYVPKKPKTSFLFFTVDCLPKIKKRRPNMKQTEIMQVIGMVWSSLNDLEK